MGEAEAAVLKKKKKHCWWSGWLDMRMVLCVGQGLSSVNAWFSTSIGKEEFLSNTR